MMSSEVRLWKLDDDSKPIRILVIQEFFRDWWMMRRKSCMIIDILILIFVRPQNPHAS